MDKTEIAAARQARKDRMSAMRREHDERTAAAKAMAVQVGKAMAKSGITKAGGSYSAMMGYEVDGYQVKTTTSSTVIVYTTKNGSKGMAEAEAIHAYLTAAGFTVESPRMSSGYVGAMDVTN